MLRRKHQKIYKLFSSNKKESYKNWKNGDGITKNISYILKFIYSTRFVGSSLSNLVNILSEGIHKIKCKYGHDDKNAKFEELNVSIVTVPLNTQTLKMIK